MNSLRAIMTALLLASPLAARAQGAPNFTLPSGWSAPANPPPPPPPLGPTRAYGALDQLSGMASSAESWDQAYRRAPSGSVEEQDAVGQVRLLTSSAAQLLSYPGILNGYSLDQLAAFMTRFEQGYQRAPSGSALESFYRQTEQSMTPAALSAIAASASYWRAQDLEAQGVRMDAGYRQAPSGGMLESFYRQAERAAFDAALNALSREAYGYAPQTLYQLETNYDQSYRQAPSGSVMESYYARARDLIHQRLSQPSPVVAPPPPPGGFAQPWPPFTPAPVPAPRQGGCQAGPPAPAGCAASAYPVTAGSAPACIYQAFVASGYRDAVRTAVATGADPQDDYHCNGPERDPAGWLGQHPYLYDAYPRYFRR